MKFFSKPVRVQSFIFFTGVLQLSDNSQGWLKSYHFIICCTQKNEEVGKSHQLFPGLHGEHFAIHIFWVNTKLLVIRISPFYLVSKVIFMFLALLNEMRLMDEYKILSFLFLVLIIEMRTCSQSKISLCVLRVGKLLMRRLASGVV